MEKTLIMVGIIDEEGYELENRVYAGGYISYTESGKRKDKSPEECEEEDD